jgi:hypothetical protein
MSKGKIALIVITALVLVGSSVGATIYFTQALKDTETTANNTQPSPQSETTQETQTTTSKTPTPLPIEYTGNGDSESEVYHLAAGSYYLSYSVGVNPSTIQGSGGYGSVSIELVNLSGESFEGVDEYNSGDGGTLSLGETVNKSDGQSRYSKTERVTVVTGDYKITVKGGGVGPRVTDWSVKLYM